MNCEDESIRQLYQQYEESRKQLLENRKVIRKRIASLITDSGFRRRGRSVFYRFEGENAVFLYIDHPTSTFYVQYGVYPLYMPPMPNIFFLDSERLSFSMDDRAMDLPDAATQEELDAWCDKADSFFTDRLMPFCQWISTAEGMACFLKKREQDRENWRYPPPGILSILGSRPLTESLMYAELAAHAFSRAAATASAYLTWLDESTNSRFMEEASRQSRKAQARQMLDLASGMDPTAVDAVLNGWRRHNTAFMSGAAASE